MAAGNGSAPLYPKLEMMRKEHKYYDRYDEKILVLASLLIATVILFVLTFFLGCGHNSTENGLLNKIVYSTPKDTLKDTVHNYTRSFSDDTTKATIKVKWAARCTTAGCTNTQAEVYLVENKNNCIVHALLPDDPVNGGTSSKPIGTTDVIITYEMTSFFGKDLYVHQYHIFADGTVEQM